MASIKLRNFIHKIDNEATEFTLNTEPSSTTPPTDPTKATPTPSKETALSEMDVSLFETIKLKLTKFLAREDEYRLRLEVLSQVQHIRRHLLTHQFYKEQIRRTHTAEQFSALFGQFDGIFMLHQQMKQRLNVDNVGNVILGMVSALLATY